MKLSCTGCKALDSNGKRCDLRYSIEPSKVYNGKTIAWKPLEECPKPKTNTEYCELLLQKPKTK